MPINHVFYRLFDLTATHHTARRRIVVLSLLTFAALC